MCMRKKLAGTRGQERASQNFLPAPTLTRVFSHSLNKMDQHLFLLILEKQALIDYLTHLDVFIRCKTGGFLFELF